jgi:predicted Holliday junction resolvase-like endonuclease
MRLSIDVTSEQHKQLKAIAALQGQSLKDYVLKRVLPENMEEGEALRRLEAFLEPRIKEAGEEAVQKSVTEIFEQTLQKAG